MNDTVRACSAQYTIAGKCRLIVKLSCAWQLARLRKQSRGHAITDKLGHIVELTSSSCLLELASYTVVLAQNGIAIKFHYKYRVQDKLHNGLCPVQIRPFVTEIRVVLLEAGPRLPIALIIDIR